MSKRALEVLAECVDVRTGRRFAVGETFDPAPTEEQARRLVAAGCLPAEALSRAGDGSGASGADFVLASLRQDGPTIAEFVAAGYPAASYPPPGYAARSTPEEIAAAVSAGQSGAPDEDPDLAQKTVDELKAIAEAEGVQLAGVTKKADIIAAIRAARAAEG